MTLSGDLAELRRQLDGIDAEVVELAAKRLGVVKRIREAKQASGKHVFDRAREQEVLRGAETRAEAVGLDPRVARALLTTLIEASHGVQQAPHVASQSSRRVLIVGGAGKMGTLFRRLFTDRGHRVDILEECDPWSPEPIGQADVVMVAVPMSVATEVTAKVAPHVRDDALLCDINSLKGDVCNAMRATNAEALGLHPMFGPTVKSLRRQKVVLCEVRPGPMGGWLEQELGRMGAEIVRADPAAHDRAMAVVQVLTHFGIMVMGRALAHTGLALSETLSFTSPIYRLELAMVGRLFSQSPELYQEILLRNPQAPAMRSIYAREVKELSRLLDEADRGGFVSSFEEVSAYFADFSSDAMELSDHIIDTVMSRP